MNIADAEREMEAHSDEAKRGACEHLAAAVDSLKHGEDDNALSHILDACRLIGRAQAFADLAEDMLAAAFSDDTP